MLDLDTMQYLSLHDLINITENPDSNFVCENEDQNELYIRVSEEHTPENF